MKKLIKPLVIIGGLISIPLVINHMIFKKAGVKDEPIDDEFYYNWKYGKIRYIVCGKGTPLLLVHGLNAGASLNEWENNIKLLSETNKVFALDLIGFGNSSKPNISYSSYLLVSLINDFVKDVIGDKVNIAASSGSGALAVMSYYFEPKLYKKMLLISPTGVAVSNSLPEGKDVWLRWLLASPILGTSIYNFLSSKFYIKWILSKYTFKYELTDDTEVNKYYHSAHYGGVNAKYPVASLMTGFLNVDIRHVLPKVTIPIHIVWGDDNDFNSIVNFQDMEALNPRIDLTIFEGSKVLPHYENPEYFNSVCKKFF